MSIITFVCSFFGGGAGLSWLMFHNHYTLPLIFAMLVFVSATTLYILSIWWGPWALQFVDFAARHIYEDYYRGKKK